MSKDRNAGIWCIFILFLLKSFLVFKADLDHSGDGWGYACEIIRGNYLSGHHLLYNLFGKIWLYVFSITGAEPIQLLTEMNVVFACATLVVIYKKMKPLGIADSLAITMVLFIAGCFGFLRYSIENETYIIPLFFGSLGLYFLNDLKFKNLSWFFLSVACLFHQIYIFWLIPVLVFNLIRYKSIKGLFGSFTVVSIPYFFAALYFNKNLLSIVFQDVESGLVNNYFSLHNVLLGIINVFRSFIEIHGRILPLLKSNVIFLILFISILVVFSYGLIISIKFSRHLIKIYWFKIFNNPLIWIFLGTLLFAFWSNGNAEFMVAIPILLFFIAYTLLTLIPNNNLLFCYLFIFSIWIWNIIFYVYPKCSSRVENNTITKVKSIINQLNNINKISSSLHAKDSILFISMESAKLYNCLDYLQLTKQIQQENQILFAYPYESSKIWLHSKMTFYTDLYSDKNYSREVLQSTKLKIAAPIHIDSIMSSTGMYRISKIDTYFIEY